MVPKKETATQNNKSPIPAKEIEEGIKTVEHTTEDILTQATKAVGTVMDLSKQASKLAASMGLGGSKDAVSASTELTKEVESATNTLMTTSVDMLHAGSDAVKTTARIGVNALNTSITLGKDLVKVVTGVAALTGEVIQATGEIFEVSGKMIKTLGSLIGSSLKIFK